MYNLWNRVNAVFFYGVTALFLAAAASNVTLVALCPRLTRCGGWRARAPRAAGALPTAFSNAASSPPPPPPARSHARAHSTLWFTPAPLVHSLALRDLRNFKAQKDPSLPRSHLMDRAVFTIDLDAGAWGVGVGGGRLSERTSGSPEWVLRTRHGSVATVTAGDGTTRSSRQFVAVVPLGVVTVCRPSDHLICTEYGGGGIG